MMDLSVYPKVDEIEYEFVKTLEWFDGDLLVRACYEGDDYLVRWVDCDENYHRWMILRVSEKDMTDFENGIIPLEQIMPDKILDDFVYLMDKFTYKILVKDIPDDYLPGKNAFLSRGC